MEPVQIRLTKKVIEKIDLLIQSGLYSNRSEAIREAIRRNLFYLHENGILKEIPMMQKFRDENR